MPDIDPIAERHRTLSTISQEYLPDHERYDPDRWLNYWFNKMHGGPFRAVYAIADKQLVRAPYWYHEVEDEQERFRKYATGWERLHSRIPFGYGSGNVDPLVNENMTVIGHVGTFCGDQIYVPPVGKGGPTNRWYGQSDSSIDNLLKRDVPVVAHRYAASAAPCIRQGFGEYGPGFLRCSLITDPEGNVLHLLRSWANDGVEPSSFSPLDLIDIAKLVALGISAIAAAVVIRMAARRLGRKAIEGAARRELVAAAEVAEEEIDPILDRIIQRDPIAVSIGGYGKPGNLIGRVDVDLANRQVIYRVRSIILRGEGDAADISLARAAHREMIRRAAKKAEQNGLTEFKLLGENANPNFQLHADKLGREIGIANSGLKLPGDGGQGFLNYQVTLQVSKVRASNAVKITRALAKPR